MIKHDSGEVPRTNTQQLGLDPRIFHNDKYTNLIHIDIRLCRLWLRFGFRVRPPSTAPIFFWPFKWWVGVPTRSKLQQCIYHAVASNGRECNQNRCNLWS